MSHKTYDTQKSLAADIQWHGPAHVLFDLQVGLNDLPEGMPGEVVGAWAMLEVAKQFIKEISDWAESVQAEPSAL